MNTTAATNSSDTRVRHQRDTAPDMMRAVTQDRYGGSDTLAVATIDRPGVAANEVLIEVHAAGVDRGVWHLMTGEPYLIRLGFGLTKPKQPIVGLDVAGRVTAVGDQVDRFTPGDEVFGIASGSFAEFAVADQNKLAHKPGVVSMEHAGVAAVSGITALQALTEVGEVQQGQSVLVIGASGGVGTFAVQLAKELGAEVTGVASTAKVDMVRELGADRVIDYTTDDFVDDETRYDLILDIGGRNSIRRLRRALSPAGTLVIVGGEDGGRWTGGIGRQIRAVLLSPFVGQRLTMFISKEHHSYMESLATHLESGAVTPEIDSRFTLDDAASALRRLEEGRTSGKSVIVVRPDANTG